MNEEVVYKSVQLIRSIGPKRAESLKKIGIETIKDLLFYFPSRHLDRSNILPVIKAFQIAVNGYGGEVTIIGKVQKTENINFGRKQIFKVRLKDSTGYFEAVWFQGVKYFQNTFIENEVFAVSGKPVVSKYGQLQFVHPDFDRLSEEESNNFSNTGKIIPFYKIPKQLKEGNLGDFSLRKIISSVVSEYYQQLEESLPHSIVDRNALLSLQEAVRNFHFPQSNELLSKSIKRMKYEEIFYLEIMLALKRKAYKLHKEGNSLKLRTKLIHNFLRVLPFELTEAQKSALAHITRDMESKEPMNRLLQGDVGSGKTIVALIAMLIAVDNGFQAILMAPTEILADQHAKTISALMKKLNESSEREIRVNLLLGKQKKSLRGKKLQEISDRESDIIIGTHALFEQDVHFSNPGLIVIDEQHRFGVEQRARLLSKGNSPDVLIMSATPIPRTLSMTLYGDLDVTIINELPGGRKKIKTVLRGERSLPEIYKFILEKTKEGYQSFVIYPLVEESEKLELKAAETYYTFLKETYFKELRVGLIHGRMSWQEKEEVMYLFKAKQYDVLVSTSVIEVGIDIPDANIMVINDASRFGLSQLHQLRGRIGRSSRQAYCILMAEDELLKYSFRDIDIEYLSPVMLERYKALIRLQTMVKYNDGFKIAEIDFKLRGPGNIFSTAQSGFPDFRFINIAEDQEIISRAKNDAFNLIEEDVNLNKKENQIIKRNLDASSLYKFMLSNIA